MLLFEKYITERFEMPPSEKNKRIIAIAICLFWFAIVDCVLLESTLAGPPKFHWIISNRTGERLPVVANIFLYGLAWAFFSMIPSTLVFLFSLCVYSFLHRKDKQSRSRYYTPPYEEEMDYGGAFAFRLVYFTTGILMLFHITNLIEIKIPGI